MANPKGRRSLRGQMTFIILICWLLPLAMAAAVLGSYLAFGLGRQTRQAVEELKSRYQAYQKTSGRARNLLEQGLREVDGIIKQLGGTPPPAAQTGPGYDKQPESETPPAMKTDFRA